MRPETSRSLAAAAALCVLAIAAGTGASGSDDAAQAGEEGGLREVPGRPRPLLELGNPFLGPGRISPGITLPTGATWQPSLLVFGNYRTAFQSFEQSDGATVSEWANRLDLFANLTLTGSERLLVGVRPLDRDGAFSGYRSGHRSSGGADSDQWQSEWNAEISTLFFEGDFGELFPGFDRRDRRALDIGFSVGRQPLLFQEGLLIDDSIDALGLTRNTVLADGTANARVTALIGWGEVHRGQARHDDGARLFGLFTELDRPRSTFNLDFVLVRGGDTSDSLHVGLGAVQRFGRTSTAFRVLTSVPLDRRPTGVGRGSLFFAEVSWPPKGSHDVMYLNGFLALDQYSPAARDPLAGTALGRTGILFSPSGLGGFGAALNLSADDVAGAAFGYQKFFHHGRRQVVAEIGGYRGHSDRDDHAVALGARYAHALGQRFLARADAAIAWRDGAPRLGGRVELHVKF